MKKLICLLLSVLMILSAAALVACDGKKAENVKLGLGIYTEIAKATNAEGDQNGQGQATMTIAFVALDADGKIVACQLDTADVTVDYTGEGKALSKDSFKTKYEAGKDYNMVGYGGAAKEWYEQADAFETVVCGKTVAEVKALVAEGDKGTDDVIAAGCTIMIGEFVKAIEKAAANAVDSAATTADTLKLGVVTEQSVKDASEDAEGSNQIETTFFAAAVNAEGKIVAAASDCVQVKFTFDAAGKSTFDTAKAVASKREAGANYGMSQWGTDLNGDGTVKEWHEQADAFNAATVGKTAGEINSLLGDNGYGNADLQTAGCTIAVSALVKAAAKIG